MARTKNTARSNPFVLPRATLADHLQAITVSTEVDSDLEIRDTGVASPPWWMHLKLQIMLILLHVLKMFYKRVSQSP